MPQFDSELWRSRAWARHQRALASSKVQKSSANAKYERDLAAISGLTTLVTWCVEHGLQVEFKKIDAGEFDPEEKLIKISSRLSPERQLFFLLHESGHFLIGDKKKHQRFGMGWPQIGRSKIKRTFHHRIDVVDEELEAWFRGRKLSKRLKLRINLKRFDAFRTEALKTYLKWALKIDGYGDDDEDCGKPTEKTMA